MEKAVILSENAILKVSDFSFPGQKVLSVQNLNIEAHEKLLIKKAIDACQGNYSLAATELGVSRKTLYNKVKKYDL